MMRYFQAENSLLIKSHWNWVRLNRLTFIHSKFQTHYALMTKKKTINKIISWPLRSVCDACPLVIFTLWSDRWESSRKFELEVKCQERLNFIRTGFSIVTETTKFFAWPTQRPFSQTLFSPLTSFSHNFSP